MATYFTTFEMFMINCPYCETTIEPNKSFCTTCDAKKGYLRINNVVLGKTVLIFFGLIIPLFLLLFGIAAQNQLGLWLSLLMALLILFTTGRLIIGNQWFKSC